MSFFSRLFGGRQSELERQLRAVYAQMLMLTGISPTEAKQAASEAIAACKQAGTTEGTADLPEDFGDRIIDAARMGEPKSKRIVEKARKEGATDDDIREFWNLPDLCRRMVIWSENVSRFAVFLDAKDDDGLSPKDAGARVFKMFPIYGDPEDTSKLSGDNRPIPYELRGRIDSYRLAHGAEYIAGQLGPFSSYNAFVRHAIKNGLI